MNVPEKLLYATTHEWASIVDGVATVGISDHAQAELTDVVFVELPQIGAQVTEGAQACVIESVKTAGDIYAPVTGEVTEVNEELSRNPALVNSAPYTDGWIFKVKLSGAPEGLMTADEYKAKLG